MECSECGVNVRKLETFTDKAILEFCIKHKLVLEELLCPKCEKVCYKNVKYNRFQCNYRFQDRKRNIRTRCNFGQTFYKNTFFSQAKLSPKEVLIFCKLFITEPFGMQHIKDELSISRHTFDYWLTFCQEVCIKYLHNMSVKLGGEGRVVNIDEAQLRKHKSDVASFGRGQWAIGGYDEETRDTLLVPVTTRNSANLLIFINEWILPGTTILSNCWRAYDCLETESFKLLTTSHSLKFLDPSEKRRRTFFLGNLARDIFLKRFRKLPERLHHFCFAIADLYDITKLS